MSNETREEFIAAHANGWVVVYIGREKTPKRPIFTNIIGPFDDRPSADRRAASIRGRYRRAVRHGDPLDSDMISVNVRPLWKPEIPDWS
jgi:hypothetical protein